MDETERERERSTVANAMIDAADTAADATVVYVCEGTSNLATADCETLDNRIPPPQ